MSFQSNAFQADAFQLEASGDVVVLASGVSGAFNVGSPSVVYGVTYVSTGVSAGFSVGTVSVTYGTSDTNVSAAGVSATFSAGSVTTAIGTTVLATGVSAQFSVGSVSVTAGALGDLTVYADGIGLNASLGNVRLTGYEVSPAPAPSSGGGMVAKRLVAPKKPQQSPTTVTPSGVEIVASPGNVVPFVGAPPVYRKKTAVIAAGPTSFVLGNVVVKIEYEPLDDEQEDLLAIMSILGNL